ncbi:MAG: 5'-nucleotidase [Deltaproteobacteria bacterium]
MKKYIPISVLVLSACSGGEAPVVEGTVIGQSSVDIDTRVETTHSGEAAIGNYIADVLGSDFAAHGHPVDVSLLNAGAIRGGPVDETTFTFLTPGAARGQVYPAGDLTDIDVAGWLPFSNDQVVMQIDGGVLLEVLERSASALPADLANLGGGWLLHPSAGLHYEIDCAGQRQVINATGDAIETPGTRIRRIELSGEVIFDRENDIDLLADTSISIGLNSFLADGRDGFLALGEVTDRHFIGHAEMDWVASVRADIEANSPITPASEGRIVVHGSCNEPLSLP